MNTSTTNNTLELSQKEKRAIKAKAYYESNKQKILAQQKTFREANREAKLNQNRIYRETHKKELRDKERALRKIKGDEVRAKEKVRRQKRQERNPLIKIKDVLRSSCRDAFKRIGQNKPTNTQILLGCTWKEAKAHFESLFQEGMNWQNHGKLGWHIDHIRPASSFTKEDMHLMNHISNLQPLWWYDNLSKSDRWDSLPS